MVTKEKLYEAFGELVYVIAKADGLVQEEEIEALHKLLKAHPWASDIQWSFSYEAQKNSDPEQVYKKAMDTLVENGPDPEYTNLLNFLEEIARSNEGVSDVERQKIDKFKVEFKEKLIEDLEKNRLRYE